MSAKLYEKIGRQHQLLEEQNAAYVQLLNVLAGVVTGEIDRTRLMVNLSANSWELAPPGLQPSLPATINGQPVCVVAPCDAPTPPDEPAPE